MDVNNSSSKSRYQKRLNRPPKVQFINQMNNPSTPTEEVPTDEGQKAAFHQPNTSCFMPSTEYSHISWWACDVLNTSFRNASSVPMDCDSSVSKIPSFSEKPPLKQVHEVEFDQIDIRETPEDLDLLYSDLNWDELNYSQSLKKLEMKEDPEKVRNLKLLYPMVVQHRKKKSMRMNEIVLPRCDQYTISPSVDELTKLKPTRLKRVWNVRISNQFGEVRFMEPISLLGKNIDRIIAITPYEIAIMYRKWAYVKVHLIFENFAYYSYKSITKKKMIIASLPEFAQSVSMKIRKFNRVTGKLYLVEK